MTEGNQIPPPPPPSDPTVPISTPANPTFPMGYESGTGMVETNPQARQWGMITHLSALVGLLGIPTIIGPLVVWMIKKNELPFVDQQGKEAMNFHLTALIAAIVISPTICIGIGVILLIALGIGVLVLSVIAGIKANEGVAYRYPMTLRLIK